MLRALCHLGGTLRRPDVFGGLCKAFSLAAEIPERCSRNFSPLQPKFQPKFVPKFLQPKFQTVAAEIAAEIFAEISAEIEFLVIAFCTRRSLQPKFKI